MVREMFHLSNNIGDLNLFNRVVQNLLFPFKEDLCRFDFEVDPEDEYMCMPVFIAQKQE